MSQFTYARRHSCEPAILLNEDVEPWRNQNPLLPIILFRKEKSKSKGINKILKNHYFSHQLVDHSSCVKQKESNKILRALSKVNINLYRKENINSKVRLPSIEHFKRISKISKEGKQASKQLKIQRKIFLIVNPEKNIIHRHYP